MKKKIFFFTIFWKKNAFELYCPKVLICYQAQTELWNNLEQIQNKFGQSPKISFNGINLDMLALTHNQVCNIQNPIRFLELVLYLHQTHLIRIYFKPTIETPRRERKFNIARLLSFAISTNKNKSPSRNIAIAMTKVFFA